MVELAADAHHRAEAVQQVAAEVQLRDARTRLADGLLARAAAAVRAGRRHAHAVEEHDAEVADLGQLAADLVEADLLGHLARDDDLAARPQPARGRPSPSDAYLSRTASTKVRGRSAGRAGRDERRASGRLGPACGFCSCQYLLRQSACWLDPAGEARCLQAK